MACTSKAELLELTEKEFAKLHRLIAPLTEDEARQSVEGTSIKDVIGHRAHWIRLYLRCYEDGMAGKKVYFPAEGYKWNDLKRYNSDLREKQAHLDWSDACALLRDRHAALRTFLLGKSDAELYSGPMLGANNKWTPGRWAEAAGPSHYRSATKFIRSILRAHPRP